jgi:glycerol-3-phosphate dehydrogenase
LTLGKVAVVGGGINGLCIAWQLAIRGWQVELFERGRCLQETSSTSTKLLHGGLRYLEQGHLSLVAESLRERGRWLREVPEHCRWLPLLLPIYRNQQRPGWQWMLGLGLYDGLALGQLPGFARWLTRDAVLERQPELLADDLHGAWQFWDGQMDERALGSWVQAQAVEQGVIVHEHCRVEQLNPEGWLKTVSGSDSNHRFDWIVNASGPWAVQLLDQSGLSSAVQLDLVRGSHLLVPPTQGIALPADGLFVEVPGSRRIAFVLPYQGELLIGTTEEGQGLDEPISPSPTEREQLYTLLEHYLPRWLPSARDHGRWISGLRPIVHRKNDISTTSREAEIQRLGRLITIYGGKWTTARSLAQRLAENAPFNGQP